MQETSVILTPVKVKKNVRETTIAVKEVSVTEPMINVVPNYNTNETNDFPTDTQMYQKIKSNMNQSFICIIIYISFFISFFFINYFCFNLSFLNVF